MLEILTDISPVNLLASSNVEIKDNVMLSIVVVHEISCIFYFLVVKLEAMNIIKFSLSKFCFEFNKSVLNTPSLLNYKIIGQQ